MFDFSAWACYSIFKYKMALTKTVGLAISQRAGIRCEPADYQPKDPSLLSRRTERVVLVGFSRMPALKDRT